MKNFKELDKRKASVIESEILASWGSINKITDEQIKKRENNDYFVFYDGPAFANGFPGLHHLHLCAGAHLHSVVRQKEPCHHRDHFRRHYHGGILRLPFPAERAGKYLRHLRDLRGRDRNELIS